MDQWLHPPEQVPPTFAECLAGPEGSFGRVFKEFICDLRRQNVHIVYVVGVSLYLKLCLTFAEPRHASTLTQFLLSHVIGD